MSVKQKLKTQAWPSDTLFAVQRAWSRIVRFSSQARVYEMILAQSGLTIDPSSLPLLIYLHETGPIRMSDAADALGLKLPTLSRQVSALRAQGLLSHSTDPEDSRAKILQPTARGKRAMDKIEQASWVILGNTFQDWSETDLKALVTVLHRLSSDAERNLTATLSLDTTRRPNGNEASRKR